MSSSLPAVVAFLKAHPETLVVPELQFDVAALVAFDLDAANIAASEEAIHTAIEQRRRAWPRAFLSQGQLVELGLSPPSKPWRQLKIIEKWAPHRKVIC
jgi:hypothetical protein